MARPGAKAGKRKATAKQREAGLRNLANAQKNSAVQRKTSARAVASSHALTKRNRQLSGEVMKAWIADNPEAIRKAMDMLRDAATRGFVEVEHAERMEDGTLKTSPKILQADSIAEQVGFVSEFLRRCGADLANKAAASGGMTNVLVNLQLGEKQLEGYGGQINDIFDGVVAVHEHGSGADSVSRRVLSGPGVGDQDSQDPEGEPAVAPGDHHEDGV